MIVDTHQRRVRPRLKALWLFLAVMSLALPARAAEETKALDPAALDRYIAEQVQQRGLVGVSVAVVDHGQVVLAKGYGKSSLASGAPVTPETMFAVGSITKQFTAACILLLAEEGRLSVHDKVAKYFPDLTDANEITLLDLMNHVSGYPDFYPLDFVDRRLLKPIAVDQLIHDYGTPPVDFPPGSRWSYSNTGFVILGRVVEKTSGEPFRTFLKQRILLPLGMEHTLFDPAPGTPGLAQGYRSFALSPPEPAPREAAGWVYSAGGIYSTPSDLARWDLALVEGKVLKPESYQLMTSPRKLADGRWTNYGGGLGVRVDQGDTILSHGGAVSGFLASNLVIPRTRSAVIVFLNSEEPDGMSVISRHLVEAVRGEEKPYVPKVAGPPAVDAAKAMFRSLASGHIDRSGLGEEFSYYLTDEKVHGAAATFGPYGEPTDVKLMGTSERGGMEVATVLFTFGDKKIMTLMYRTPDGKVQEFLLWKE